MTEEVVWICFDCLWLISEEHCVQLRGRQVVLNSWNEKIDWESNWTCYKVLLSLHLHQNFERSRVIYSRVLWLIVERRILWVLDEKNRKFSCRSDRKTKCEKAVRFTGSSVSEDCCWEMSSFPNRFLKKRTVLNTKPEETRRKARRQMSFQTSTSSLTSKTFRANLT